MRRRYSVIVALALLFTAIAIQYVVANGYREDTELLRFPIPNAALLDKRGSNSKHFHWAQATGTDLPLTYKLAIRQAGFTPYECDGQQFCYEKDERLWTVIPSTDYVEILMQ